MIILKTHGLDSGTVANISISQLQQKLEVIGLLCKEVDTIRAKTLGWKEGMDHLALEKEIARAQLSSVKSQLQGMKEKNSVQARKIEDLEARLASKLAKAKSEAKKAKAEEDTFVAAYRADAEAAQVQAKEADEIAQTRAYWVAELAKCQSWRETLEEIHAQGFDLTEEIKKAKELEFDAGALASDDDDDGIKKECRKNEVTQRQKQAQQPNGEDTSKEVEKQKQEEKFAQIEQETVIEGQKAQNGSNEVIVEQQQKENERQ
ncbi:uncharacterized protein [Nicotiana tomentosiformis]|uniref:uncharacterized protein n=1 Tax=Nicotiana tomentosiformis TaxID=4098 RepID=UPI00388CB90F